MESLRVVVKRAEREHLVKALNKHQGDAVKAAKEIGISKASMYRKIAELEINNTITYK